MTISPARSIDTTDDVDPVEIVAGRRISFTRTVDRALTHHHAVSEVFVTDLAVLDGETFVAGAQLPRSHPYFMDRVGTADWPVRYDAFLLGECARQACTYLAHVHYGAPTGQAFLAMRSVFELLDGPALAIGDRPAELAMVIRARTEVRGGALRLLRGAVDYVLGGEVVAHSTSGTVYVSPASYRILRAGDRAGALPSSNALVRHGIPVAPGLVGRSDPRNVLLADAAPIEGGIRARVDVTGAHPTLFDHPQDHYPAMLLADAAAQAAMLATYWEKGPRLGPLRVVRLVSEFSRFAELDADLGVRASMMDEGPGPVTVDVSFVQYGSRLATVLVTLDGVPS